LEGITNSTNNAELNQKTSDQENSVTTESQGNNSNLDAAKTNTMNDNNSVGGTDNSDRK
jgi:hypothetical protein